MYSEKVLNVNAVASTKSALVCEIKTKMKWTWKTEYVCINNNIINSIQIIYLLFIFGWICLADKYTPNVVHWQFLLFFLFICWSLGLFVLCTTCYMKMFLQRFVRYTQTVRCPGNKWFWLFFYLIFVHCCCLVALFFSRLAYLLSISLFFLFITFWNSISYS